MGLYVALVLEEMEGLSTKKAVTVGLQENAIPPGHGSTQGPNFSSIPLPPPHGNVRSGKPAFINGSTRSTTVMKEAEASQTEAKNDSTQASSQGHGDREADIDKRLKRFINLYLLLYLQSFSTYLESLFNEKWDNLLILNQHAILRGMFSRRILASRRYSQKYRLRQLQHIAELETEAKALQVIYANLQYSSQV